MRRIFHISIVFLTLLGCGRRQQDRDASQRNEQDRKSAAFKAGEIGHELSKEAGKAAAAAGRELRKDAHEAHEGWKQAEHEDRAKKRTTDR
jgi:uncharacterized lipoprotein NlpE involved in copper resistance